MSPTGSTCVTGGPRFLVYRLFGCCFHHRYDGNVGAAFGFSCELNFSVDEREQRMIFAHADIAAGMPSGAALATNDVARRSHLAARFFQSEAAAVGIATVA